MNKHLYFIGNLKHPILPRGPTRFSSVQIRVTRVPAQRTAQPTRARPSPERRRPTAGRACASWSICKSTLGLLCNPTSAKRTVPLVYHLTAMPPKIPTFMTTTPPRHPRAHRRDGASTGRLRRRAQPFPALQPRRWCFGE